MYKTSKYTPTDKMSYLICDNYTLLQVMSRFDLSLGFGCGQRSDAPGSWIKA